MPQSRAPGKTGLLQQVIARVSELLRSGHVQLAIDYVRRLYENNHTREPVLEAAKQDPSVRYVLELVRSEKEDRPLVETDRPERYVEVKNEVEHVAYDADHVPEVLYEEDQEEPVIETFFGELELIRRFSLYAREEPMAYVIQQRQRKYELLAKICSTYRNICARYPEEVEELVFLSIIKNVPAREEDLLDLILKLRELKAKYPTTWKKRIAGLRSKARKLPTV